MRREKRERVPCACGVKEARYRCSVCGKRTCAACLRKCHQAHEEAGQADPVYEEIHVENRPGLFGVFPAFPLRCPVCLADGSETESPRTPWMTVKYACGGAYRPKPQIQNHTYKWWGHCEKAVRANSVGLAVTVPDGVLHDARVDAGLEE